MKDFSPNQAGNILDKILLCDPYGFHISMKEKILLTGNPKLKSMGIPWETYIYPFSFNYYNKGE
jgi:hypothetical protein